MSVLWAWNAGGDRWISYGPDVSAKVEAAYLQGESAKINIDGRIYVVDPAAMTQVNEASGGIRQVQRVDPAEAAATLIGRPIGEEAALAEAIERSIQDAEAAKGTPLQRLEPKVTYVALRISKAAKANSRMACALLLLAFVAFACFVAAIVIATMDSEDCHCEKGGTGYREDNGYAYCADGEVEVCHLEVAKMMLWGIVAACFFGTAVLATLSNPPRFWLLRELKRLRAAVEQAIGAEADLRADSKEALFLQEFCLRGHNAIDACDQRVRVDKWTCSSVRANWCAFLAQGWVTYAEACKIRAVIRSAPQST